MSGFFMELKMKKENIPFEQAYEIWKAALSCHGYNATPQDCAKNLIEAFEIIAARAGTYDFAPDPEQPTREMKEGYRENQAYLRYFEARQQSEKAKDSAS